MPLTIRSYSKEDKTLLIKIFHSNCPKYFEEKDLSDFLNFLDQYADEHFKVVIYHDQLIGCGGHYIKHDEQLFGIAWVMFRRFSLGHSQVLPIASRFFDALLANIEKENLPYDIVVNTTQLMEHTFNRYGFRTEKVIEGGFGTNLDHYIMRKSLSGQVPE